MAFEGVPSHMPEPLEWCRRIALVLNRTIQGKMNCVNTVTLTANASSTVINLAEGQLGSGTLILFDPLTSHAAAEIASGSMYIASADRVIMNKRITITHANNSQTDREFRYALIG